MLGRPLLRARVQVNQLTFTVIFSERGRQGRWLSVSTQKRLD